MSKLAQDLKQVAAEPRSMLFLLKVIQGLLAWGGPSVLEDMANLVDRMIATRVNPFRQMDARFTPEVMGAMVEFLDLLSPNGKHPHPSVGARPSTISAPPEAKDHLGLMDGDTIKPQKGKARVAIARANVLKAVIGDTITFSDLVAPFHALGLAIDDTKRRQKFFSETGAAIVQQLKKDRLIEPVSGSRGLYVRTFPGKRKLKKLLKRT